MTAIFTADSANEMWLLAYKQLSLDGSSQGSRLGITRETLHANFHLNDPRQRWILSRLPALNPAFAIAEVFWILSGDENSSFLNYWNPRLPQFAGNGSTYHGAYGYRIRKQFGFDQLEKTYLALKSNSASRQIIIQIWDPNADFPTEKGTPVDPDIPCNICSMPKIRNGKLEWLQIMRSNDLYLGTPHNVIQFSTVQEILAGWLELELGAYHQISDSLHVYEKDLTEVGYDTIALPENTDSLALPKKEFDQHLTDIYALLQELTTPTLSKRAFNQILSSNHLNTAYNNLLCINAADSARRRGWKTEMKRSLEQCSNDLLKIAFGRWEKRYPIRKTSTQIN